MINRNFWRVIVVSFVAILGLLTLFYFTKQSGLFEPDKDSAFVIDSQELEVLTWNIRHFGKRKSLNLKAIIDVLSANKSDVITIQELTKNHGHLKLKELSDALSRQWREQVCFGFSRLPTGSNARYGFLWRLSRVYYVSSTDRKALALKRQCDPNGEQEIPLASKYASEVIREPAAAMFYFRPRSRLFILLSVHLVPTSKKPEREVEPLFLFAEEKMRYYSQSPQKLATGSQERQEAINPLSKQNPVPVVVAGDFNLGAYHVQFNESARRLGFLPVLLKELTTLKRGSRELSRPFDNIWYRNLTLKRSSVINLYQFPAFLDWRQIDIYTNISDHNPVVGRFSFLHKRSKNVVQ